jgi:hypothetical protein
MSLVIQTNSSGAMGQHSTIAFNQNVRVGSSIVVGVTCNQNFFTSASITDSQGNTYSLVKMSASLTFLGAFFWTAIYVANSAVGGADTLTVTFTGTNLGNLNKVLIAEVNASLAGTDGTATAGVVVGDGGESFPSMSLPVTNAGEVIFTLLGANSSINQSAPIGYSSVTEDSESYVLAWTQNSTAGTDSIQWGGTLQAGGPGAVSMVAASFTVPVAVPPAQATADIKTGNAIQFFGVNSTTPATVQTQSNTQQLFTFDTTSRPGVTQLFRYADDANFLGRTAMPGQLLVLPGNGWFRGSQYFVCASGTVTIPLAAQNAGVSFTLYSNKFKNLASSGLNIQVTSDVLAALPNTSLGGNTNSYQWSLVGSLGGSPLGAGPNAGTSPASCAATWNLNGVVIGASGSSMIDNGLTGPKLQMSLGVQFSGTVSGNDQFQATCSQFEIQEI